MLLGQQKNKNPISLYQSVYITIQDSTGRLAYDVSPR